MEEEAAIASYYCNGYAMRPGGEKIMMAEKGRREKNFDEKRGRIGRKAAFA
jgi:hypothetical protein